MLLHSNIIGKGKPFIILHGFLGMGDNWKSLAKRFSAHGFEVHLVDQRNHGRSFHDDNFNYEVMVEDLNYYCEHYGLEEIIVLGHSMGGKTAMLYAAEYPQMVSNLIVADISPRFYPIHHDAILEGLTALDFDLIKTRNEADETLSNFISEFEIRQFLLKNVYWIEKGKLGLRVNLEVLKELVEEVGEAFPVHSKYDKETLFLRGDRSEYIGLEDETVIIRHFPKAKIVTICNAGHWLHAENPNDFYEVVMQFIN